MCQENEQLDLASDEEEVEMVVCESCGEDVPEEDANECEGAHYCDSCHDEVTEECVGCDTLFIRDNMRAVNNDHFCTSCHDATVVECVECGCERHENEMTVASNDEYFCSTCASRYVVECDRCHNDFHEDDVQTDTSNNTICNTCFERHCYRRCADCNTILRPLDQNYREHTDAHYCDECDPGEPAIILDYSHKPSPIFHTFENDSDHDLFLGVEIEMDGAGCNVENAEKLYEIANKRQGEHDHIYIKQDGSICHGFEVVSHPCTLQYHMECFAWKDVLREAVQMGYRSHQVDTCGLHVHVSRQFFGSPDDGTQDLNVMKFLYFIEKFWEQIKKFSRRTNDQISSWANRYGLRDGETPEQLLNKAKNDRARYRAVNLTVSKTVEVRIFRGTLKYNTFIATIQFVALLARFSKQCAVDDVMAVTWEQLVAAGSEFTELQTYLQERGLGGLANGNEG